MSQIGMRPVAACCLALFLLPGPTLAATAYRPTLTQNAHTGWRVQDGDFVGQASSIAQTRDGYLWIGTEGGLERYDGARFRHWALPQGGPVYAVLADRDGSLWLSQGRSLMRLQAGRTVATVAVRGRINSLYQDGEGTIWLVRSRTPAHEGALCKVVGAAVQCFGQAQGQPCDYAGTLTQDQTGEFLIGGPAGVCAWRPGATGQVISPGAGLLDLFGIQALEVESDGSLLMGGKLPGVQRRLNDRVEPFTDAGPEVQSRAVSAIYRDRGGALWLGTTADGIYHLDHGKVDHFDRSDGLSGSHVNAIFEDREENVWVGTSGGLDRFHRHAVSAVTIREGMSSDSANSVLARRDGSVWIGTDQGLNIVRNGSVFTGPKATSGRLVTSMAEDHAGRLWIGLDEDLAVLDDTRLRLVAKAGGGKFGAVLGLAEDSLGAVWAVVAGRPYRLYHVLEGQPAQEVHLAGKRQPGLIAAGRDGTVWIADKANDLTVSRSGRMEWLKGPGTAPQANTITVSPSGDPILSTKAGVYYLAGGHWTRLDTARGLPCNNIYAAVIDQQGGLWLHGECGIILVERTALQHALQHPLEKLKSRWLDSTDGAPPGETSFSPSAAVSTDGRLWFATDNAPLTVDRTTLAPNLVPPPVYVEQVVADHRTYSTGSNLTLPSRTRDVEISYSALSFVAPQKTRYRYRLSDVDEQWQEVGTRRTAFYMNLKPGHYRFQVIASNNDGVWNTNGDRLEFTIRPAFFQTLWFQALSIGLAILLVWFGLWLRVRYVAAEIEARLSERQAERMRIARELHDTLLQGFQGLLMRFQVVADAIPKRSRAKPMMEVVLNRAEDVLTEGRDRVHDLRSVDAHASPLMEALRRLADGLELDGCGPINFRCVGVQRVVDDNAQKEILAIAKEALSNCCRHAQAPTIECCLIFTPWHVRLVCEDTGIGIDAGTLSAGGRPGHWGLTGMRERARQAGGGLTIHSQPGRTRVEFKLNTRVARLKSALQQLSNLGRS